MKYLKITEDKSYPPIDDISNIYPLVTLRNANLTSGLYRFKPVDYITMGSTITQSYFLIPYIVNTNTTSIEQIIKFKNTNAQQRLWAVKHRSNLYCETYVNSNHKIAYALCNNDSNIWKAVGSEINTNTIYQLRWTNKSSFQVYNYTNIMTWSSETNNWIVEEAPRLASTASYITITNTATDYLLIGASFGNSDTYNTNPFNGKLYGVKITENNKLVYDLRPVKFLNQGALYDVVSKQIFMNQSPYANTEGKMTGYGYYADDLGLTASDEETKQKYYQGWLFCDF